MENAKNFYDRRKIIINAFKNDTFPFYHDEESRFKDEDEDYIRDKNSFIDYKKLNRNMNNELVTKRFLVQDLGALLEKLKKSKNNTE